MIQCKNRQCLSMIHSSSCCSYSWEGSFITKVLKYTVEYSSTWRSNVWISSLVLLYWRICISIAQPINKHHVNILHTSISEGHYFPFRAHEIALHPSRLPPMVWLQPILTFWRKGDSQLMAVAMLPFI